MSRPLPDTALPSALPALQRWVAFGALMLGLFTILSASTSVSTAIPAIQRDFHASLTEVEWIVDSYLLTLTAFLATFGRLGDVLGRKRLFVAGGVVFTLGCMAGALAGTTTLLIATRALTGLGPAMMMPATLSLITDLFPPARRGLPLGIWGSMAGVAVGMGPVVGGLLVSTVGWRWVFWSAALLGLASISLAAWLLPKSVKAAQGITVDLPGVVLSGISVLALTFALIEGEQRGWTSMLILGLFLASAVLFALFVWRELRARSPLVNLALFREPAFSAGILSTMTLSFGILAIFVYMPLFLQGPKHDSPVQSGLTLLPLSIAMALVGPVGGLLANRVPPRWPISAAFLLFTGGMWWLAHLTLGTDWQWLAFPFAVVGIGLGLGSANINTAVMRAVPRAEAGSASGVVVTVRQLGSVLGVAVLGAVLQNRIHAHRADSMRPFGHPLHGVVAPPVAQSLAFTEGLNDTFLVCAGVLAIGVLLSFFIRHRPEGQRVPSLGADGAEMRVGG